MCPLKNCVNLLSRLFKVGTSIGIKVISENMITYLIDSFERKDAICPVLHPLMPMIFTLIEKCIDKYWGVDLVQAILTHVPEVRIYLYLFTDKLDMKLNDLVRTGVSWSNRFSSRPFSK